MLQRYGLCTLTSGSRALRDLDLFRPGRDAFASTLTALDDAFSRKWERNAALPADRIDTLRIFHDAGIFTWVSLKPVLDTDATFEIIRRTHTFVGLYKMGRANYIGLTKTIEWKTFTHDVLRVLAEVGARHYIKQDLQPYLPAGYDNPMRVRQFRVSNETESLPILPWSSDSCSCSPVPASAQVVGGQGHTSALRSSTPDRAPMARQAHPGPPSGFNAILDTDLRITLPVSGESPESRTIPYATVSGMCPAPVAAGDCCPAAPRGIESRPGRSIRP